MSAAVSDKKMEAAIKETQRPKKYIKYCKGF